MSTLNPITLITPSANRPASSPVWAVCALGYKNRPGETTTTFCASQEAATREAQNLRLLGWWKTAIFIQDQPVIGAAPQTDNVPSAPKPATPRPAHAVLHPNARSLFTSHFRTHLLLVSSARLLSWRLSPPGRVKGHLLLFIESARASSPLPEDQVCEAVEHLIDDLNYYGESTVEFLGAENIEAEDYLACSLPDGYAVTIVYTGARPLDLMDETPGLHEWQISRGVAATRRY